MDARALNSGERATPDNTTSIHQRGENLSRYRFASYFIPGKLVLDAGCGIGYGSNFLMSLGPERLIGVDASQDAIAYAKANYRQTGLEFCEMGLTALEFPDRHFDTVVMIEVIEHIDNPAECLAEISRVLKEDGVLILSTPNQAEHPGELFNPYHVHEYTREELKVLLSPLFPHFVIYNYGWTIGMFAWPIQGPGDQPILADPFLVDLQVDHEPPFFLAVCSQSPLGWRETISRIFPYSLDRRDRAQLSLESQDQFNQRYVNQLLTNAVRAYVDHQKFEEAILHLEILVQAQPPQAEWNYLLAFCLQGVGRDLPRALQLYDRALELGFDEFWIRYNRGILLGKLGSREAARRDLERAVALSPAHQGARQLLAEM